MVSAAVRAFEGANAFIKFVVAVYLRPLDIFILRTKDSTYFHKACTLKPQL